MSGEGLLELGTSIPEIIAGWEEEMEALDKPSDMTAKDEAYLRSYIEDQIRILEYELFQTIKAEADPINFCYLCKEPVSEWFINEDGYDQCPHCKGI